MRPFLFLLLAFGINVVVIDKIFAQTTDGQRDSLFLPPKVNKPWSLGVSYGWNTHDAFSQRRFLDESFESWFNLGLEVKRNRNPGLNWFAAIRFRFDGYAMPAPDYLNTRYKVMEDFFFSSLILGLEKQYHFSHFDVLVSGGPGFSSVSPAGLGHKYSLPNNKSVKSYSSDFLERPAGFNGLLNANICLDYYLFSNIWVQPGLRLNYEFYQNYPLAPIRVETQDEVMYQTPIPRRFHAYFSLGLAVRF